MRICLLFILSLFLLACEGEETVNPPNEDTPPNETNPSTLVVEIEESVSPCELIHNSDGKSKADCPDLNEQK